MKTYVTHLESALDSTRFEPGRVHTTHAGRPLLVRYDLSSLRGELRPSELSTRPGGMWRYRELLPLPLNEEPVSLGETTTPLLRCSRLGAELSLPRLLIKDESRLPTGSFKSRGLTVAVSMARHLGLERLAVPTAGNAGGALAAYAARAGMEAFVFMPADTPQANRVETFLAGARAFLVNGLIGDCGKIVREGTERAGWFDMSTLKEPYRLEGKKTMGLELAEQLDWRLPDVIFYPTGGGTGLIGMWKAFQELAELGWLQTERFPRLISCQAEGCAPLVRAYETGARFAEPISHAHTCASGLRVPSAVGDFMILDAVRASGGRVVAGRESKIAEWMHRVAATEGISICPETAVCFDCLEQLAREGYLDPAEEIVVFNTGAGQKYPEVVSVDLPLLDRNSPIDYEAIVGTPLTPASQ